MLMTFLIWAGAVIGLLALLFVVYVLYMYRRHMAHRPKATPQQLKHRPRPAEWRDTEVTFAWIGHSTILLNLFGVKIITDPVLCEGIGVNIPGFGQIGPKRFTPPALTVEEMQEVDIDLILLSHAHLDHVDLPTLRMLARRETQVITAKNTARLVNTLPFGMIEELEPGQSTRTAKDVTIHAIPVRHWGNRFPWNTDYGYNGYVIEKNGVRILYPGDTAYISMTDLPKTFGKFDLVFMPIGAYSPDSYQQAHCTPEQAWQMFEETGADWMVPIHWNTFVLSREPIHEPIQRLREAAGERRERILMDEIGDTKTIPE